MDIRNVNNLESLITYFSKELDWNIDINDFDDIDDMTYDFEAEDLGLKEEAFAKIISLRQLPSLVDNQKWGIFSVEFDSRKFEITALRKILSGLIPKKRNSADHAVWNQHDLLFICFWGEDNEKTIGIAHFEDKESGLPQIKMISCAPNVEDFTQIQVFKNRLSKLRWPSDSNNTEEWHDNWALAFTSAYHQVIQDSSTLTQHLALEAQGIRDRIMNILKVESKNGYVHLLYDKFKNTLIHDMTTQQFADMYSQTVVYGLFSARCMDDTQEDFSASEAVECIPNTNPFLKNLMRECLGAENNTKLSFDELEIGNVVDLLLNTNTDAIIQDFNRQTGGGREDPVIHFYEEFLTEYDKTQKVQRGVYYTPQPVVNFIVKATDNILKNQFELKDGLASDKTKQIKIHRDSKRKINGFYRSNIEDDLEVPAIQILDPATGTGTFLRQTILQIYEDFKNKHNGESKEAINKKWNEYVPKNLLPRLNGFELMMAPYAVAHMKLAMVLKDTGYDFSSDERLNVFLSNTLEEAGTTSHQLSFLQDPLATESVEANIVKVNHGINVVIGNPPYNVSSNNRSEWIMKLLSDYKEGLTEKKLNLDDDYIKFFRFAQNVIENADSGIISYITNNSYIDGVSHRRIRECLLKTFDQIYIIDLHGNVMKQEKNPNGGKDENVFDITQGVAVCLLIKKKGLEKTIKHFDLYGTREYKYNFLMSHELSDIEWTELKPLKPEFLFIPYKSENKNEYEKGFKVSELFKMFNSGIQTKCDEISVCDTLEQANEVVTLFKELSVEKLKEMYPNKKDGRDWSFEYAKRDILNNEGEIVPYYYRPFDVKYIRYSGQTKGLIAYPRRETMNNMVGRNNIALCMMKQFFQDVQYNHIFITNLAIDERFLYSNRGGTYIFPLYQYYGDGMVVQPQYNFDSSIIGKIEHDLGLKLSKTKSEMTFTGEELLQYIYAILYCRSYREKFNDQLKYSFPSIPYPKSKRKFYKLAEIGEKLMNIHLPNEYYVKESGNVLLNELTSYKFEDDKVILNNEFVIQGVDGLKEKQLGGYKPADKWLKDRKGKPFTDQHLSTYKKIIDAIIQTDLLMDEIDNAIEF